MYEQRARPFIKSTPTRARREECPGPINQCRDFSLMAGPHIIGSNANDVACAFLHLLWRVRKCARQDREMKQRIDLTDRFIHRYMLLRLCCLHKRKGEMKTIRHEDAHSLLRRDQKRGSSEKF